MDSGVAHKPIEDMAAYRQQLRAAAQPDHVGADPRL